MKKFLAALLAAAWLLPAPAQAAPEIIDRVATAEKIIALTVEDIASAAQFEEILSLFREQGVKATFFIDGRLAGQLPLKKAAGLGHEIGNHSLTHPFWGETGSAEIAKDLAAAAKALEGAAGTAPKTVRPPYNWYGDNFLQAAQALVPPAAVIRGKDAGDWLVDTPAALVAEIVRAAAPGDILNFNLQAKTAAAALPAVIVELKRAGYGFATASTLLAKKGPAPPGPLPGPTLFAVVKQVPTAAARLALTFDDGGPPWQVENILAALERANVRSTFFLTGEWAAENPGLVRRMAAGGHEIANHSYSHPYLVRLDYEEARGDILAAQQVLTGLAGTPPRLFRPPYGAYNQTLVALIHELGFRAVVLWDVDTRDWSGAAAETVAARVAGAASGSIVLFHLHGAHTAEALEVIIPALRAGGYELTTVSDLLDIR